MMQKLKKSFISFIKKTWPVFVIVLIVFGLFYYFILKDLPSPTMLGSTSQPQSSQIYDRNGKLLYNIYSGKNQTFVPLKSLPKYIPEASIAIEDQDFYHHGAVDFRGIARAAVSILFHKQIQGGSTITQQLVKTTLLSSEQTVTRKIKEAVLAFVTEIIYPKDRILELYLNEIPYGGTTYGIEAAAQTYFGKHAKDLDIAEAAFLAGLPQAPSQYSPYGAHPELGKQRQLEVLSNMQKQGYITSQQEDQASKEKLKFKDLGEDSILAPHFVFYIKQLLEDKYGAKAVEQGGLKVITSLDMDIQNMAQASVSAEVDNLNGYNVTNGAALVTNPMTGEILAMVGSRDYFDTTNTDGNVNMTTALRQPGSSIKPLNYALGLINGYNAATPFIDMPICYPSGDGKQYCPQNYDGKWHGVEQMRYSLGNSFNIPAVKMLKVNTVPSFIATAGAMGISTFNNAVDYGLSLTLGGGEVHMIDMATAYGVFANGGYRIDLHPILKVTDNTGKVLEEYTPPTSPIFGKKVFSSGVAFIISSILSDNGARLAEFGPASALYIKNHVVPVKTGTTNDFRDNWTIGYTQNYVVATWVGNNNNTPMSNIASGITGAAPIWHDIMAELLKNSPTEVLQQPANVIQKAICSTSGLLPPVDGTPNKCATRFEYFISGTEPKKVESNENVWVDKSTQDLAKPGQTDNVEMKSHLVVTDPTGDRFCVDCPHPELLTPTPTPGH